MWFAVDESRPFVTFAGIWTNWTSVRKGEPRGGDIWFAIDETRPLLCFVGIWTEWTSVRKVKEGETTNDLYAFPTTEPNDEVGAIHPKAIPVILTTPDEVETWMTVTADEALKLQRPLPDGAMRIVGRGQGRSCPRHLKKAERREERQADLLSAENPVATSCKLVTSLTSRRSTTPQRSGDSKIPTGMNCVDPTAVAVSFVWSQLRTPLLALSEEGREAAKVRSHS
ncbi:hypothetical protein GWG67_16250 [Bradyrhizobium sp. CSS354]|nr:hypothetical protein [Bradyrhizobium sp. CSS354]